MLEPKPHLVNPILRDASDGMTNVGVGFPGLGPSPPLLPLLCCVDVALGFLVCVCLCVCA